MWLSEYAGKIITVLWKIFLWRWRARTSRIDWRTNLTSCPIYRWYVGDYCRDWLHVRMPMKWSIFKRSRHRFCSLTYNTHNTCSYSISYLNIYISVRSVLSSSNSRPSSIVFVSKRQWKPINNSVMSIMPFCLLMLLPLQQKPIEDRATSRQDFTFLLLPPTTSFRLSVLTRFACRWFLSVGALARPAKQPLMAVLIRISDVAYNIGVLKAFIARLFNFGTGV